MLQKELEHVTGVLSHCATVVKGGRTFTRRLFNLLKATRKKRRLKLSSIYKDDLEWWDSFFVWFNGKAKVISRQDPSYEVFTDSSKTGFGAAAPDNIFYGTWSKCKQVCDHHADPPMQGSVIDDQINVLELWPVLASLIIWGQVQRDKTWLLYTDNTQVQCMLQTGRSSNTNCMHWLREIFWRLVFLNINIVPKRVSTCDNTLADALSRLPAIKYVNKCAALNNIFSTCCNSRVSAKGALVPA